MNALAVAALVPDLADDVLAEHGPCPVLTVCLDAVRRALAAGSSLTVRTETLALDLSVSRLIYPQSDSLSIRLRLPYGTDPRALDHVAVVLSTEISGAWGIPCSGHVRDGDLTLSARRAGRSPHAPASGDEREDLTTLGPPTSAIASVLRLRALRDARNGTAPTHPNLPVYMDTYREFSGAAA